MLVIRKYLLTILYEHFPECGLISNNVVLVIWSLQMANWMMQSVSAHLLEGSDVAIWVVKN